MLKAQHARRRTSSQAQLEAAAGAGRAGPARARSLHAAGAVRRANRGGCRSVPASTCSRGRSSPSWPTSRAFKTLLPVDRRGVSSGAALTVQVEGQDVAGKVQAILPLPEPFRCSASWPRRSPPPGSLSPIPRESSSRACASEHHDHSDHADRHGPQARRQARRRPRRRRHDGSGDPQRIRHQRAGARPGRHGPGSRPDLRPSSRVRLLDRVVVGPAPGRDAGPLRRRGRRIAGSRERRPIRRIGGAEAGHRARPAARTRATPGAASRGRTAANPASQARADPASPAAGSRDRLYRVLVRDPESISDSAPANGSVSSRRTSRQRCSRCRRRSLSSGRRASGCRSSNSVKVSATMVNYISGLVFVVLLLLGLAIAAAIGQNHPVVAAVFGLVVAVPRRRRLVGDPAGRPVGEGGRVSPGQVSLDQGPGSVHDHSL